MGDESMFLHECIRHGCEKIVEMDDEPWCFEHSPDDGSHLPGYSARRAAEHPSEVRKRNIFEDTEGGQ